MPAKSVATDFAAHRTVDDLADPFQVLPIVARLLGQERRIRGDAIENAEGGERFDFLDVAGIHKELHRDS
jgi:hypothetical protein